MKPENVKDCPVCGAKDSMKVRINFTDTVTPEGYTSIKTGPLNGRFCKKCGEGFLNRDSEKLFDKQIAEGKARQDSNRLVISQITDVDSVVKIIKVSRQRIHKMMEEGKLPFVFIGERRYPVKNKEIFDALSKSVKTHTSKTGGKSS